MTIKFCSEAYFFGIAFFNEPEISNSDPLLKVSPRGLVLRNFYVLKKMHRPQPGLNPRTLEECQKIAIKIRFTFDFQPVFPSVCVSPFVKHTITFMGIHRRRLIDI